MKKIWFLFLVSVHTFCYAQSIEVEPIPILYQHFKNTSILLAHPLNTDSAFYRLFPGTYIKEVGWPHEQDTAQIVIWTSYDFPLLKMNSRYEVTNFPFNINDTRLLTPILFSIKGTGEFICLPTTTSSYSMSLTLDGRFSCGVVGLGLFKKELKSWKLIGFNPAITCIGSYSTAPQPRFVRVSKNDFVFVLEDWNGGAGGAYRGNLYIISLVKNNFEVILTIPHIKHGNDTDIEWDYEIKNSSDYIIINWTGSFSKKRILEQYNVKKIEDTDLPEAIKKIAFSQSIFKFKLIQKYKFSKGILSLVDEKINLL